MSYFLQQIAQDLAQQYPNPKQLKEVCLVFPTRRAGTYFCKHLAQLYRNQSFFAPMVWNIVEFTEHLSETVILDQVPLVLELFKTYKQLEPEVRFDSFYAWGKLILDDFDEIDRYMVDAVALFSNLKDLRHVEESFALSTDQLGYLQQFWRVLQKDNPTYLENEFIKVWEVLGQVYQHFKQALIAQNAAYMGMAQRQIVEQLENNSLVMPFKKIIFAGFNDLTTTEERIINYLVEQKKATIYWDTDRFYMSNKTVVNAAGRETTIKNRHEAGNFLRKHYQQYAQNEAHKWHTQSNFEQSKKNIHIVGIPLYVGQAKYAGQTIQQQLNQQNIDLQSTALILGDQTLLSPMLYALPENIETVNVTMGYPLRHTPIYQLLDALVQLQKTRQDQEKKQQEAEESITNHENESNENTIQKNNDAEYTKQKTSEIHIQSVFYSKIVLQIINNPYIKSYNTEAVEAYMTKAEKNNWVYVKSETICRQLDKPIFEIIFKRCETFLQLTEQFDALLLSLFVDLKEKNHIQNDPNTKEGESGSNETNPNDHEIDDNTNNNKQPKNENEQNTAQKTALLELEFIYHALLQVRKLSDSLRRYRHSVSVDTFWKILREILQSTKLAFEGEPLQGLQILDFLEARTLDFKNLFILGMNEGIIPSTRPNATFIPINLRRAFAMPTFLDQDAIYAYHFYRLLQRAENVWLLYNTETNSTGGEEKSRYLLQLLYELNEQNAPHINIQHRTATAPLVTAIPRTEAMRIPKKGDITAILNEYVNQSQSVMPNDHTDQEIPAKKYRLSPTAICSYINCPVEFYYKYIAQLKELSNIDEDINALIFGNVLHSYLELLYQPYKAYPITSPQIDRILSNTYQMEAKLNKALKDNNFEVPKQGRNLLLKRVLKRLGVQILENDKKDVPFSIVGLEASDYETKLMLDDGRTIALHGTIDRIDQVNYVIDNLPTYRILDYKTGIVKINMGNTIKLAPENYFENYFQKPEYKAGFQAYMYAYLFWVNNNRNVRIIIGIYELKNATKGITYLRGGELISNDFFEAFEQKLKELLSDLFNYDLPFIQTSDLKRYDFSPYKKLAML